MIAIKTGEFVYASSDADAELEICDISGTCCKTSGELDNSGVDDREEGNIDIYKTTAVLGTCFSVSHLENHCHHRIQILQATLGAGGVAPVVNVRLSLLNDAWSSPSWYAQWIQIQLDSGDRFRCPVNAWIDPAPRSSLIGGFLLNIGDGPGISQRYQM